MTDSLSKPVLVSVALHFSLIAIFTVRALLLPSEPLALTQAIRVDIVGLPEKEQTLPESQPKQPANLPAPAPAVAVKEKPVPTPPPKSAAPKVSLEKLKKSDSAKAQKKALNQIKALEALDRIKNEVSTTPSQSRAVKGNIVAAGNSLTGLEKIDYDRYLSSLEEKLRQNWSLPQWLADAKLRGQAVVLIDTSGAIKKKWVVKSSGNPEFDAMMMDAIEKSAPFPPPPGRLRDVLAFKGITLYFPQRGSDT
jgi:colicin import membrane protein